MTDLATMGVISLIAVPVLTAAAMGVARSPAGLDRLNVAGASLTSALALALAVAALAGAPGVAAEGRWYLLDPAAGVFLLLVGVVGVASAGTSITYLRHAGRGMLGARHSRAWYYAAFNLFWAALLAVPLADNLGIAWLLVEATTAASAVLVAFSGRRSSLEAGWKYVVLTTLGLTVSLLGIVVLFAAVGTDPSLGELDWAALGAAAPGLASEETLIAFVLIVVGMAGKIGWAPVHNWLPDAHSEAPPPISAMLSAALLPTVLLVVWRTRQALEPALPGNAAEVLLIAFGLASLLVAIPFLWRALPFKRLLAYSSLEHMGVLALGLGFATPLAIAGVVVHVLGHGLAKSLGFYAALPILREDPKAATMQPRGIGRINPRTGYAYSLSMLTLAGLPPLPLFVSEVMILLAGIQAGMLWVSIVAAVLLALGFLGLAHATLEGLLGKRRRGGAAPSRAARPVLAIALLTTCLLLALSVVAVGLPGSDLVEGLLGGGG